MKNSFEQELVWYMCMASLIGRDYIIIHKTDWT